MFARKIKKTPPLWKCVQRFQFPLILLYFVCHITIRISAWRILSIIVHPWQHVSRKALILKNTFVFTRSFFIFNTTGASVAFILFTVIFRVTILFFPIASISVSIITPSTIPHYIYVSFHSKCVWWCLYIPRVTLASMPMIANRMTMVTMMMRRRRTRVNRSNSQSAVTLFCITVLLRLNIRWLLSCW